MTERHPNTDDARDAPYCCNSYKTRDDYDGPWYCRQCDGIQPTVDDLQCDCGNELQLTLEGEEYDTYECKCGVQVHWCWMKGEAR